MENRHWFVIEMKGKSQGKKKDIEMLDSYNLSLK